MLFTRNNRLGGPELTKFPIDEDEETGIWGIKLGYCKGCNEPLLIRTIDASVILAKLRYDLDEYEKLKISMRKYRDLWTFIGDYMTRKVYPQENLLKADKNT